MDERRASRTFASVAPFVAMSQVRVLDYGGGNGKIMEPFIALALDAM